MLAILLALHVRIVPQVTNAKESPTRLQVTEAELDVVRQVSTVAVAILILQRLEPLLVGSRLPQVID